MLRVECGMRNGEDGIGAWNDVVGTWRLKYGIVCDKERYAVVVAFGV
jgi:hypothetical protein